MGIRSLLGILEDAQLESDIANWVEENGTSKAIIERIIKHVASWKSQDGVGKKRKLDTSRALPVVATNAAPLATIESVSVTAPIRKKCDLIMSQSLVIFRCKGMNECVMPIDQISYVLCLPTPEKIKPHWTFILVPTSSTSEPACFGVDDKGGFEKGAGVKITNEKNEITINQKTKSNKLPIAELLEEFVCKASRSCADQIIEPSDKDFKSVAKGKLFVHANMGSRQG